MEFVIEEFVYVIQDLKESIVVIMLKLIVQTAVTDVELVKTEFVIVC